MARLPFRPQVIFIYFHFAINISRMYSMLFLIIDYPAIYVRPMLPIQFFFPSSLMLCF